MKDLRKLWSFSMKGSSQIFHYVKYLCIRGVSVKVVLKEWLMMIFLESEKKKIMYFLDIKKILNFEKVSIKIFHGPIWYDFTLIIELIHFAI